MRRTTKKNVKKQNNQIVEDLFCIPTTKSVEDMTLLELVECVVDALKSDDDDAEPINIQPVLALLAKRFDITERQALLFSLCISEGPYRINIDYIAETLGVNRIKMLTLNSDINALIGRQLLRYYDVDDEDKLAIPPVVFKALKHNKVYAIPSRKGLSCFEIFDLIKTWINDLEHNAKTQEQTVEDLRNLFNDNLQVEFARKMAKMELEDDELLILCYFCHQLVHKYDDDICTIELEDLFEPCEFTMNNVLLQKGEHGLLTKKLLENVCMDGIACTTRFKLTEDTKIDLLSEVIVTTKRAEKQANVLEAETLIAKEMFYTEGNAHQVGELGAFFQTENYRQIKERMRQRGFRSGFACLFYGGPGTGKTETVYQLARQTGRNIMVVDVPQIKSKWVGDSEKNIKALFDQYRKLVKSSDIAPILLFNEADAIIGTRMSGAESAVDKMENSIQNIILQEMENLDGIMVATTNLEGNLDPAFERRFLYKIHFEKPDAGVRTKIWRQLIPELTEEEALALAANYDFSGGQIENIARKNTINSILYGDSDNLLPVLRGYCENERLGAPAQRRIGF